MAEDKKYGSGTVILKHDCINTFQDDRYGKGNRVMNGTGKGFRCTVCGANVTKG